MLAYLNVLLQSGEVFFAQTAGSSHSAGHVHCGRVLLDDPAIGGREPNKLVKKPPYTASEGALNLHKELTIADLHADSLLWGRDLLERGTYGQVDIPRLADGNVALQVFSLPTKSPHGLNIESNEDKNDDIFWLAIVDRWPPQLGTA